MEEWNHQSLWQLYGYCLGTTPAPIFLSMTLQSYSLNLCHLVQNLTT